MLPLCYVKTYIIRREKEEWDLVGEKPSWLLWRNERKSESVVVMMVVCLRAVESSMEGPLVV